MGYHITILRTVSGTQQAIIPEEIRAALVHMNGRIATDPAKAQLELYIPEQGQDGEGVWYTHGELWASNPSDRLTELMIELATHLGARVRGDEGETYRTLDDTYVHPDDQPAAHTESEGHGGAGGAGPLSRSRQLGQRIGSVFLTLAVLVVLMFVLKEMYSAFFA